jgi:hypothetical protein
MAGLFEACSGGFGGHSIPDQSITSFLNDEPLFKDFGLSLVQFSAEPCQPLGAFFESGGEFSEGLFLLSDAPLPILDVAYHCISFFFAPALFLAEV